VVSLVVGVVPEILEGANWGALCILLRTMRLPTRSRAFWHLPRRATMRSGRGSWFSNGFRLDGWPATLNDCTRMLSSVPASGFEQKNARIHE
jgi:hypothetical protein